jgi:hypothetical protein
MTFRPLGKVVSKTCSLSPASEAGIRKKTERKRKRAAICFDLIAQINLVSPLILYNIYKQPELQAGLAALPHLHVPYSQ